jgi:hypothetical protein
MHERLYALTECNFTGDLGTQPSIRRLANANERVCQARASDDRYLGRGQRIP